MKTLEIRRRNTPGTAMVLAASLLTSLAHGSTDSGTNTEIFVHRASGTVFVKESNIHDSQDCTLRAYSPRLRRISKPKKACEDILTGIGGEDHPGDRGIRPLRLSGGARALKKYGFTKVCRKAKGKVAHCILHRMGLIALGFGKHDSLRIGRPWRGKDAHVLLLEVTTGAGMIDEETGECVEGCMDEHQSQRVVLLPPPGGARLALDAALRAFMPRAMKQWAKKFNARGLGEHRGGHFQEAAESFGHASRHNPTKAIYVTNRASALCRLGKKKEALAQLGRAKALDAAMTRKLMRQDRDYDSLRKEPAFQALLK